MITNKDRSFLIREKEIGVMPQEEIKEVNRLRGRTMVEKALFERSVCLSSKKTRQLSLPLILFVFLKDYICTHGRFILLWVFFFCFKWLSPGGLGTKPVWASAGLGNIVLCQSQRVFLSPKLFGSF